MDSRCCTQPVSQAPCRGPSWIKSVLPQPPPMQLRPPQGSSSSRDPKCALAQRQLWFNAGRTVQASVLAFLVASTAFCILHILLKSCSEHLPLLSFQETTDQDGRHNPMRPELFPSALQHIKIQRKIHLLLFPCRLGMPCMPKEGPTSHFHPTTAASRSGGTWHLSTETEYRN